MMKNRRILTVSFLTCLFSSVTYAGWLGGPSDYDECILEEMKGVTSDVAAQLIRQSCKKNSRGKPPKIKVSNYQIPHWRKLKAKPERPIPDTSRATYLMGTETGISLR